MFLGAEMYLFQTDAETGASPSFPVETGQKLTQNAVSRLRNLG